MRIQNGGTASQEVTLPLHKTGGGLGGDKDPRTFSSRHYWEI